MSDEESLSDEESKTYEDSLWFGLNNIFDWYDNQGSIGLFNENDEQVYDIYDHPYLEENASEYDFVTALSQLTDVDVNACIEYSECGFKLIHIAAIINNVKLTKWLLSMGADPDGLVLDENDDWISCDQWAPLHYACMSGSAEVVDVLLAASKASVNKVGLYGNGYIELIKGIDASSNYFVLDATPLCYAIYGTKNKEKIDKILNSLLDAGADPMISFNHDSPFSGDAYYLALLLDNRAAWDALTAWRPWKPKESLLMGYIPIDETDEELAKQIASYDNWDADLDDPENLKFQEKLYANAKSSDDDDLEVLFNDERKMYRLMAEMWVRKRYFAYTAAAS